jgi:predicted ferric reductase
LLNLKAKILLKMNKREFIREVSIWTTLFIIMVMIPLFLALVGHTGRFRGFWVEFGIGLGFIGIAMMGLQFVLTARFRNIASAFGTDALLNFHRQAGYVAYFFVLGHVIVLLAASPYTINYFDPSVNAPRAFALILVLVLLTVLVGLTIWREKLKIPYEWWRISHAIFAFTIILIGLAHMLMVSFYISEIWQKALWIILVGFAIAMLVHVRIIKPYMMSKKPYSVSDLRQETSDIWTLEIEPDGHEGITFQPGQFAWLTIGPTPFTIQQHPFSFSSSSEISGRYSFTIKELGDFTSTIKTLKTGDRIYLEGPYGAFTIQPGMKNMFFIVGGIGITPVMSMLQTMNDQKDPRPVTMLYGSPDLESAAFRKELDQLGTAMNLNVVHILEEAPEDWEGHHGLITTDLIDNYLPENFKETDFFVCGPEPMMDIAENHLRDRGVPVYKIHSERFNIV